MSIFTGHLLTWLILLPVIGALVVTRARHPGMQRAVGLIFSSGVFVLSLTLVAAFQPVGTMQFVERHAWIPQYGI